MNRIRTALTVLGVPTAHPGRPSPREAGHPSRTRLPHGRGTPLPGGRPAGCCTGECHDERLGPRRLPRGHRTLEHLLQGYRRTGTLRPTAFLRAYWRGPAHSGGWRYPPEDGFAVVAGRVDRYATELRPGQSLDRFGSVHGSYLAPAGAPYARRSLPPQNLTTTDAAAPCNYHVYRVTRSFPVWRGSAAPWFEQPGIGPQFKLDRALLDPGHDRPLTVRWLLDHGYLSPAGP